MKNNYYNVDNRYYIEYSSDKRILTREYILN